MFKMSCCDKIYSSDSKVNAVKYNVIMINHLSSGTLDSCWLLLSFLLTFCHTQGLMEQWGSDLKDLSIDEMVGA